MKHAASHQLFSILRALIAAWSAWSVSAPAAADEGERVDQASAPADPGRGYKSLGGAHDQKLAQTFTVGLAGSLVALRLPLSACEGGDLYVDIHALDARGAPTGAALQSARIAPAKIPVADSGLVEIRFDSPRDVEVGDRLGFALRVDSAARGARCLLANGPVGESYAGGAFFYDLRPNPPGWAAASLVPGEGHDLSFETIVALRSAHSEADCFIAAGAAAPGGAPACRCRTDRLRREYRCAILHPDFVLLRRLSFGDGESPMTEVWEARSLAPLDGPITLTFTGAGRVEGQTLVFGAAPAARQGRGKARAVESFTVSAAAPKAGDDPARATIAYPMANPLSSLDTTFTIGLDIPPEAREAAQPDR